MDDPIVAQKWEDWSDGFEAMIKAMKITEPENKEAMLKHYVGGEARKLLKKLPALPLTQEGEEASTDAYEIARQKFNNYFAPKMNRVYLMDSLQQMKQNPGETVDSFYMRVQENINPLNLDQMTTGELKQLITLSQLVNFCINNGLRKKP